MIDIPKLIVELERAGDGWDRPLAPQSQLTDLCRRAALALREQQDSNMPEVLRRLGLLLIELGKKLTGERHA